MAFRVSPSVALLIVFSLMAVAHCVPLKAAELTTTTIASSAAEVDAVSEGEGVPLPLPYSEESLVSDVVSGDEEVPREVAVEPVAEPDPDRSHPGSDGEEELTAKEQIDDDDDDDEEKKTRKNHGGDKEEKKKRKKRHDCDGKDKKEKKTKTKTKTKKKTKKLTPHHDKIDDSDDEDEQEKKEKRWRKAISRSMFGHGRRSQREEAAKDEVNN
ncbi:protein PXR1-like [Panicum virgatum]|uniref:protein PXR1-like n=1 Tax=Panicum virgatum TaxID=38727 RepID=UPI0019D5BA6E|nr:protein PXR1-like [Panicum virgatum]